MSTRCLGCHTLIARGSRCSACRLPDRRVRRIRGGNGWEWQRIKGAVYARDGGRCVACGTYVLPQSSICDHIVRVVDGGSDDPSNLRTLCKPCDTALRRR